MWRWTSQTGVRVGLGVCVVTMVHVLQQQGFSRRGYFTLRYEKLMT